MKSLTLKKVIVKEKKNKLKKDGIRTTFSVKKEEKLKHSKILLKTFRSPDFRQLQSSSYGKLLNTKNKSYLTMTIE